jgi:ubiquinone/menaquinone biosynthesis C-methylase UbiE
MRARMILDVGSGDPNRLHVYLKGQNVFHVDIDRQAYSIETQCDIHNLPFKENSFQIVHASHILEHITNPNQAIKELNRVSSKYVIIRVPNGLSRRWGESPEHIYSWNRYTLENLLKRHFKHVTVKPTFRVAEGLSFYKKITFRLKTYLRSILWELNEITAVCEK